MIWDEIARQLKNLTPEDLEKTLQCLPNESLWAIREMTTTILEDERGFSIDRDLYGNKN